MGIEVKSLQEQAFAYMVQNPRASGLADKIEKKQIGHQFLGMIVKAVEDRAQELIQAYERQHQNVLMAKGCLSVTTNSLPHYKEDVRRIEIMLKRRLTPQLITEKENAQFPVGTHLVDYLNNWSDIDLVEQKERCQKIVDVYLASQKQDQVNLAAALAKENQINDARDEINEVMLAIAGVPKDKR